MSFHLVLHELAILTNCAVPAPKLFIALLDLLLILCRLAKLLLKYVGVVNRWRDHSLICRSYWLLLSWKPARLYCYFGVYLWIHKLAVFWLQTAVMRNLFFLLLLYLTLDGVLDSLREHLNLTLFFWDNLYLVASVTSLWIEALKATLTNSSIVLCCKLRIWFVQVVSQLIKQRHINTLIYILRILPNYLLAFLNLLQSHLLPIQLIWDLWNDILSIFMKSRRLISVFTHTLFNLVPNFVFRHRF